MSEAGSRWMSRLADDSLMTCVAIPGAHEACSYDVAGASEQLKQSKWSDLFKLGENVALKGNIGLTATQYIVGSLAQTQELNIKQQLEAGVRFFDLRPSFDPKDKFVIFYGVLRTRVYLNNVFDEVKEFLKLNPSEYVVFRIKAEGEVLTSKERGENLQKFLVSYQDLIHVHDDSVQPTVGVVRGKVALILQDIEALQSPFSAMVWGNPVSPQDDSQVNMEDAKVGKVVEGACNMIAGPVKAIAMIFGKKIDPCKSMFDKIPNVVVTNACFDKKRDAIKAYNAKAVSRSDANLSRFYINFISCVGTETDAILLSPQVCADRLNPGIGKLLAKNTDATKKGRSGIVVMDFITEELAQSVYEANQFAS